MTARVDPVIELYELILKNPSVFGRIIQIAGLWNPETSRYERGLPDRFRAPDVDKALAKWHQAFFLDWLSQSLTEKERDVAVYWANGGASEQGRKLREIGQSAIPPLIRAEERQFFLQDLAFLQALL